MTDDLPAIRADLVKISTLARGFTQLVLEIPSEQAAKAIELLGVPTPGNSLWVAIAPLGGDMEKAEKPKPATGQPAARKGYWEKKPSQRAGIMCADPRFWAWGNFVSQQEAAEWLRNKCMVGSRSALDNLHPKESTNYRIFADVELSFRQWAGYEASPERVVNIKEETADSLMAQQRKRYEG